MSIKTSIGTEWRSLKDEIKKTGVPGALTKLGSDISQGMMVAGGHLGDAMKIKTASADGGSYNGGAETSTNRGDMDEYERKQLQSGAPTLPGSSKSTGGGSGSSNSKIIASIGKGWEDADDAIGSVKKSLGSSKNYISNLGKVRDQYIKSLDNYKAKTDAAIAGNKTLIERNQKKDLDSLAGDTRKSMDNTNVMLGVKGASGGSASRAAARAIAQSAGKSRAGVLTAYGDENSKQNQAAQNATEEYATKRTQAYEWEKTARQQALDDYNDQKKALDRLSKKKSGWKDSDIKAESDKNLSTLLNSLNSISSNARTFRDNLSAKYVEYGGLADELDTASVDVDAPAELDTPEFDENIDLTTGENAEDWFDPKKTGRKVVKGYDALGNPIYGDEEDTTETV